MYKFAYGFNFRCVVLLGLALSSVGCATSDKAQVDPRDPLEGWNRNVQQFNDNLDDYVMKPVARGYQTVTPNFMDKGVTNFFSNIDDINVVINDMLQLKLLQSGLDTSRLLVNTVVGLGGFVDVATKMSLPKHYEDLDQTLGSWGLPSGPYVVLPFLGPSSPRNLVGIVGDTAANPINWVNPVAYAYGSGTIRTIDTRADLLSATKILDEASVDRYEFIRNAYFQERNNKVYDGAPPKTAEEEELEKQMDELDQMSAPIIIK